MKADYSKKSAYVTVYFILSLSIIISLILVSLESARLHGAYAKSYYSLEIAVRSTLADYYAPLYNEYHILAVDAGNDKELLSKEKLAENIKFVLEKNYNKNTSKNGIVCELISESVTVDNIVTLVSNDGAAFFNQAVSFQKYKTTEEFIKYLLEKAGMINAAKEAQKTIQARAELEQKILKIDKGILELIKYMDGISFEGLEEVGALTDFNVHTQFARIVGQKDKEPIINNPVFEDMLSMFRYDINRKYDELKTIVDDYIRVKEEVVSLQKTIAALEENKKSLIKSLAYSGGNEIAAISISIAISSIDGQILGLNKSILKKKSVEEGYKYLFDVSIEGIFNAAECAEKSSIKSKEIIVKINEAIEEANTAAAIYETLLNAGELLLSDEFYNAAKEELSDLNNYISGKQASFPADIEIADKITEKILKNVQEFNKCTGFAVIPENMQQYEHWLEESNKAVSFLINCNDNSMWFDYSSINISKGIKNEIVEMLKQLLRSNITDMIYEDEKNLSQAYYTDYRKPSLLYDCSGFSIYAFDDIFETFLDKGLSGFYDDITNTNFIEPLKETAEELTKKALLIAYIEEHLDTYDNEEDKGNILKYEQEYLVSGNNSDRKNIDCFAEKIISIRFIMNLIYAVTNNSCRMKAGETAAAVLGFTGLTGLVLAAKYLILTVWAFVSALVDAAAVFSGYSVPFFVSEKGLSVKFSEILTVTKQNIAVYKQRYKNLEGIKMDYRDYMRFFMFIIDRQVLCFRTMDIIQANLNSIYDEEMYLVNGVVEITASSKDILKSKFVNLDLFKYNTGISEYITSAKTVCGYD